MSRALTKPVRRRATYEDLLAVPEPLVAEILFGELVAHPRPSPRHARAAGRLYGILAPPFDVGIGGPGGSALDGTSTTCPAPWEIPGEILGEILEKGFEEGEDR